MTNVNRWGQLTAAAVALVGIILPWAHLAHLSRSGISSADGLVVLVAAAVAAAGALLRWATRAAAITTTVLGVIALLICVAAMFDITTRGLDLGVGAPVAAIGSVGVVVFGIRSWLHARATRSSVPDHVPGV